MTSILVSIPITQAPGDVPGQYYMLIAVGGPLRIGITYQNIIGEIARISEKKLYFLIPDKWPPKIKLLSDRYKVVKSSSPSNYCQIIIWPICINRTNWDVCQINLCHTELIEEPWNQIWIFYNFAAMACHGYFKCLFIDEKTCLTCKLKLADCDHVTQEAGASVAIVMV